MEDKKKSRSEKMYGSSPKIMKDKETGKVTIGKDAKVNSGTEGIQEHESHDGEMKDMLHRHAEERLKMHHAHEAEHLKHAHKVIKADAKEEKTGEKVIEKVEHNKKGEE